MLSESHDDTLSSILERLRSVKKNKYVYVICDKLNNHNIVGYIYWVDDEHCCNIENMVVSYDYRKCNLGAALLSE